MTVDLARPRRLGELLSEALRIFFRNLPAFMAIAFVVVVPVDVAVLGIGLGQLSGHFDSTPPAAEDVVRILVRLLVTAPLVALMCVYALGDLGRGERPRPGPAITQGFEAFRAAFTAVAAQALAAISLVGIPLYVRWYLAPQVVAVDKRRGRAALDGSFELTRGNGWRTAGILLVTNILLSVPAGLLVQPLVSLAKSNDSEAMLLGSTVLLELLVAAPTGLVAGLLFYDLRARRAGAVPPQRPAARR